jgi:hypothetical protein
MTRRRAWWAVAILVGGVTAGCSNDPPPIQEAKKVGGEEQKAVDLTPGKAPEKSDPAAAAVVNAAVAAHTGGKPEKLKALKAVTFTRTGPATFGGPFPVDQKWTCHAAWPDRFRVKAEVPGQPVITLAWSGGAGWSYTPASGKKAMTPQEAKDFQDDVTGDWLTLVFPLTEPTALFTQSGELTVNGKPSVGVRVWHPALSDAVAYFDKETKLLSQVTYSGREGGQKVTKEVTVFGSRPFADVTLPEKTVLRSSGKLYAEWTMASLEPLSSVDSKLFTDP